MSKLNFIKDIDSKTLSIDSIGGKAFHLSKLQEMGLNVPKWLVFPSDCFLNVIENDWENAIKKIDTFQFESNIIEEIKSYFPDTLYFAVRSSAIDEDGSDASFAGQFESCLYVTLEQITEKIKTVWKSALSERVLVYRKENGLNEFNGIAVIVQQMISADVSGVAFGMNPINGNRNEKVISAVFGLGEGLVSGELDADNYIISNQIEQQIAEKQHKVVLDTSKNSGTITVSLTENEKNSATLNDAFISQITAILDAGFAHFGKYQDIEFAIANETLYLLQSRAITILNKIPDKNATYTLWDNSNIIESYPGVTTPLTFSFISKSYEGAYSLFSEFLGVDKETIASNNRVFKNTLGLINGRVYYNLKSWYQMLALVPGYSINARFMESMMGVKERFDLPHHKPLSKTKAWWRIVKMVVKMIGRYRSLPRKRRAFQSLLNSVIAEYKAIDYSKKSANELMDLYLNFEQKLLNEWKAPLLNDFFAMIWFGVLQKKCTEYKISSNPNIHNDLLCGSNDIISTQPIHRSIALATAISENEALKQLFITETDDIVWNELTKNKNYQTIKKEIEQYIHDFGERCIGELKLETVSYTQDPRLFVKVLQAYVQSNITENKINSNIETEIREKAEKELKSALKGKFFKKWLLNKAVSKTRELVSSRENLRYERTRAFGIVREIFSNMGAHFYAENCIEHSRDIFYLTKEEIFAFIEGTSVTQDLKGLIAFRKQEFETYKTMPTPSERFATYGAVYHANDFYSKSKIEIQEGDLKGIGCCPGVVKAKVRVVLNPNEVNDLNGDILVTSSTDPGWVTLFPSASGIIVERGSLLSHSAIVSREMGKPCIVGVTGLLQRLKTGDVIEMDGSSGFIKLISE